MPRPLFHILVTALITLAVTFGLIYFVFTPMGLAIPVKAKRQSTLKSLENLREALAQFNADNGRYPTEAEGLSALLHPPTPTTQPYLQRLPRDGFDSPFLYATPTPGTFTVSSAGPDKTPHTADDIQ